MTGVTSAPTTRCPARAGRRLLDAVAALVGGGGRHAASDDRGGPPEASLRRGVPRPGGLVPGRPGASGTGPPRRGAAPTPADTARALPRRAARSRGPSRRGARRPSMRSCATRWPPSYASPSRRRSPGPWSRSMPSCPSSRTAWKSTRSGRISSTPGCTARWLIGGGHVERAKGGATPGCAGRGPPGFDEISDEVEGLVAVAVDVVRGPVTRSTGGGCPSSTDGTRIAARSR